MVSVLGFVFYLNSFVVREYSVYDLNPFSFIEICVTPTQSRISVGKYSVCPWGESVLCYRWVKCSVNISQVKWVGAGVQLFWLIFSLLDLSVIERKVVKSATIIMDLFIFPCNLYQFQFSSVQFSHSVVSDSLRPHESQHARPPCPSPTPRVDSNSCPSSRWCHPAISSSVIPFSSCPNTSLHQGLFQWVSSSHQVAKVLEFQLQHQSFQWTLRTDLC